MLEKVITDDGCKLYRGEFTDWREFHLGDKGFVLVGKFVDHPAFAGSRGHTSKVVRYFEEDGISLVETLNSIYKLGDKEEYGEV